MCKISGFLSHLCWCITRCWWLSWDEAWLIEQSQHQHFWLLSTTILHARYYWYLSNVLSTVLSLKKPSEIRILATHHLSKVMILMCCSRLPLDSPVTASPEISRNSSSSSNKRLQFETFPEGSRNDFSARCLRIMTHSSSWWSESCNLRSLQSLQQCKKLERLTAWKIYTQYTYNILVYLKRTSNHSRTFHPQQKTGAVPVFQADSGAILELYASPETEPRSDSSWRSCARLHTSLAKHNTARVAKKGRKKLFHEVNWNSLVNNKEEYRIHWWLNVSTCSTSTGMTAFTLKCSIAGNEGFQKEFPFRADLHSWKLLMEHLGTLEDLWRS